MQAQQARQTCHKVRRMRSFSAVPVCIWISIGGAADVIPSAALPSGLPALHADGDRVPQGRRYLHAYCIRPRFFGFQENTERRQDRQQREQFLFCSSSRATIRRCTLGTRFCSGLARRSPRGKLGRLSSLLKCPVCAWSSTSIPNTGAGIWCTSRREVDMPTYIRINTKDIDNLVRRLGSQQLAQRAQIAMTRSK